VFVWGVRVCVCVWVLERVCACASVGRTFSQVMIKKFFFLSHRHWHERSKRHRSSMFGGPWRKRERGSPDSSRGEHRFARRRCASFGMAFFMALTLLEAADSNLPVTRSNLIERTSALGSVQSVDEAGNVSEESCGCEDDFPPCAGFAFRREGYAIVNLDGGKTLNHEP